MKKTTEQEDRVYFEYDDDRDIELGRIENISDKETFETDLMKKTKKISRGRIYKVLIFSLIGLIVFVTSVFLNKRESDKQEKKNNTIVITKDFINVMFMTYEGYGEAYAEMNYDMFIEEAVEIFSKREDAKDDKDYAQKNAQELYSAIYVGVDKPYNLSNGEMVNVRVDVEETVLESLNVKLEFDELIFEVKGLVDMTEFNPFYYMEIYEIEYGDRETYTIKYPENSMFVLNRGDFDVTSSYKDGETTIHVIVKDDALEKLSKMGAVFENIGMDFNANGVVNKFVSNYDDVSSNLMNTFHQDATNDIRELYSGYDSEFIIEGINYCGGWVTTYEDMNIINKVVSVYEIKVSHSRKLFENKKYYLRYEFSNVSVGLEGNAFLIEKSGLANNANHKLKAGNHEYNVMGYESIGELLEREMLSSIFGFVTYDPNGKIYTYK